MSVTEWFLIGVAGAAYLASWWYMAGLIVWNMSGQWDPDGPELAFGILLGCLFAVTAPLVLVGRYLRDRGAEDLLVRCIYKPGGRRPLEDS